MVREREKDVGRQDVYILGLGTLENVKIFEAWNKNVYDVHQLMVLGRWSEAKKRDKSLMFRTRGDSFNVERTFFYVFHIFFRVIAKVFLFITNSSGRQSFGHFSTCKASGGASDEELSRSFWKIWKFTNSGLNGEGIKLMWVNWAFFFSTLIASLSRCARV